MTRGPARRGVRRAVTLAVLLLAVAARTLAGGADSAAVEPQSAGAGQGWMQATHITPPPQPPLVILDAETGIAPVREAFRGGDGTTRIVMLMSPT